jgi:large subunit ribosomal protein L5
VRPLSRFKEKYQREAIPSLKKKFGYKNVMQIPQIKKVVINMGVGDATTDAKAIDAAVGDMTAIAGQKPVVTKAKKSIAAFKVRAGAPIGCMVTLRGQRMHDFLDKLFNISLPRIRDFKGVSPKAFDGRGNYTLGIHDQLIFPEINYDKVEKVRGMDIVIVTSAVNDEEAFELLKLMGMPFRA